MTNGDQAPSKYKKVNTQSLSHESKLGLHEEDGYMYKKLMNTYVIYMTSISSGRSTCVCTFLLVDQIICLHVNKRYIELSLDQTHVIFLILYTALLCSITVHMMLWCYICIAAQYICNVYMIVGSGQFSFHGICRSVPFNSVASQVFVSKQSLLKANYSK